MKRINTKTDDIELIEMEEIKESRKRESKPKTSGVAAEYDIDKVERYGRTPSNIKYNNALIGTFTMVPQLPKWEHVLVVRERMAYILVVFGLIGVICGAVLDPTKRRTILATQFPDQGQTVGMLTETPDSHTVLTFTPLLSISIPAFLIGIWMAVSMRVKWLKDLFVFEIQITYMARITYYQAVIQSTVIVLTVMPLAGVVNAYELATLSALTWAEFLMYLHSDLANMSVFNNWDIVDVVVNTQNLSPEIILSRIAPSKSPNFQYNYEQMLGGIAMHTFVYIILLIHIIQSMSSPNYDTNIYYNWIVFITLFLQYLIPIFKFLQMARIPYLKCFTVYKMVILSIEIIETVNTVVIIFFLILAIV